MLLTFLPQTQILSEPIGLSWNACEICGTSRKRAKSDAGYYSGEKLPNRSSVSRVLESRCASFARVVLMGFVRANDDRGAVVQSSADPELRYERVFRLQCGPNLALKPVSYETFAFSCSLKCAAQNHLRSCPGASENLLAVD